MKKPTNTEALAGPQNLNNTTLSAQRARLLVALQIDSVTTYEAREHLNIMQPAARIIELRDQGHKILTLRERLPDSEGRLHPNSARYVLVELAREAAE